MEGMEGIEVMEGMAGWRDDQLCGKSHNVKSFELDKDRVGDSCCGAPKSEC